MSKETIIVNFIIQELKSKHTFLKKYTNWAILSHVTQNLEFSCQTRKWAPKVRSVDRLPITDFKLDYGSHYPNGSWTNFWVRCHHLLLVTTRSTQQNVYFWSRKYVALPKGPIICINFEGPILGLLFLAHFF